MYDAIVVGARCAGSPTAMLLARQGHRVLLVDRAEFPSDTLSVHYIHQPGIARLQQWGLLDAVRRSNCPPIRTQRFDVGPFALVAAPPPADGSADAYAPRRTILDKILIDAAVEAGAEFHEHFSVDELLTDGSAVTGIRGRSPGSASVTETARIVIGADGLHSRVARATGAPAYAVKPNLTCAYYSYWTGVPVDGVELYPRPGRLISAGSTNDEQTLVIVYWPKEMFHEVRSDIEKAFFAALDLIPDLAARVRSGERAEPFRGTGNLPFYLRRPHGDGWALVGDAGYHKDPISAQGITDAFRDADLLAHAVDRGFSGKQPLGEALDAYERQRNEQVMPIYEFTHQLGALEAPPPEMQALFAALRDNDVQAGRFLGTVAGTVPLAEFFAPENIAAIVGEQFTSTTSA
jgi:2-polyprenyl-6-methoxyphenol hydroxylase-like FAD-dependent oxidoreductase